MLHAPQPRRERILGYGPSGSGKSTLWLDVAEWLHRTNSHNVVHLVDNDNAWEGSRPIDGHLDHVVRPHIVLSWEDHRKALRDIDAEKNADKGDFLVVDMVGKVWDRTKQAFMERKFGVEIDEFFIEHQGDTALIGGAYGSNWDVMKKMYAAIMDPVQYFPGHVICTSGVRQVRMPDPKGGKSMSVDSPEIRLQFGTLGVRPDGHDALPHLFHTVLLCQESAQGWRLTTAKDRGQRDKLKGEIIGTEQTGPQFVVKYLMKIGGWKP